MTTATVIERCETSRISPAQCCAHCGEPLTSASGRFCCDGCAGAYHLIRELGLARYYDQRSFHPLTRRPKPSGEEADTCAYTSTRNGRSSLELLIDGLHCAACVWLIESALKRDARTLDARVNLTTRRLHLAWSGSALEGPELVDVVRRLGYRVVPYDPQRATQVISDQEKSLLRSLAVSGFAAANVMLLSIAVWSGLDGEMGTATRGLLHWISAAIALPAIVYGGMPFFRSGFSALSHCRTNMDVPISVGVVLATGMSFYETAVGGTHAYFESVVMLLFFLLIGRYLDLRARGRARSSAEQLVRMMAQSVTVISDSGVPTRKPAGAVAAGAVVLAAPGERILIDGEVIEGASTIDKSFIDGESAPADLSTGAPVLAGMINLTAPVKIRVSKTGADTFLAEILRLMEIAEQGRAQIVLLADRIVRLYAPAVHLLALATFATWVFFAPWEDALLNAVAVLIITCPCALGLAVPAVQVIASGRLMRRGILVKSGTALERLAAVDTVVFDKTGTLTEGRLKLLEATEPGALGLASGIAAGSRHPLSQALRRGAPDVPALSGVAEHPGAGLSWGAVRLGSRSFCGAQFSNDDGLPELWLAEPSKPPIRFTFTDTLRPDAKEAVEKIERSGKRVEILSGDRAVSVANVAAELGIVKWRSGLTPQEKCDALARLNENHSTLMVGDGLNDAAALTSASVSMSPATAADISQTAADIVFQGRSLLAVDEALAVARQAMRLVRENIAFAIAYNGVAVPLAMLGLVTPLLAALAMSASSLVVIANSFRLKWGTA